METRYLVSAALCYLTLLTYTDFTDSVLLHHIDYDDLEDYEDHPCKRPCHNDTQPMVCDYNFLVEHYHTLTRACWDCPQNASSCSRPHCVPTDGGIRGVITANRRLPGPGIHVCEHDTIRVRVQNRMENAEGTSIHWHGILQKGSPYMDGVSMVTQCPIPAQTAFTYIFQADTPGTHFWHGHSGLQRADGLFGHLVIRQHSSREPHFGYYVYDLPEHTLIINDWWHRETVASFVQHHHSDGPNKPTSVLINGKGMNAYFYNATSGLNTTTPREIFHVKPGSRYRFRVIGNMILNCPMRVSVDGHMLEIIASDGHPVQALTVESFNIFAGERYDFVLTADQSVGNYLLRIQGELDCGRKFENAHQTAILHYEGATTGMEFNSSFMSPAPPLNGVTFNPINSRASPVKIPVTELRSLEKNDPAVIRSPDRQIVVAMDFRIVDAPRFHNAEFYSTKDFLKGNRQLQLPQMNDISTIFPPAPALSQLHDIPSSMLCNKDTVKKNCSQEYCECVHLYKVALDEVVELVMVDQGHVWNANHPTHLHGHGFRVLAMDRLADSIYADRVVEMDKAGNITRNLHRAPIKDTVTIPDGGYTIVRFHANNPGIWFLHCHIEYHVEIGMGLLFQVGDVDEFPPVPPRFPTCGDWDPRTAVVQQARSFHDEGLNSNTGNAGTNLSSLTSYFLFMLSCLCSILNKFDVV